MRRMKEMTSQEKATEIIKLMPYWDLDDDVSEVLSRMIADIESKNIVEILKYFENTDDFHKVINILNK